MRQGSGYLCSHRASLPFGLYQIIVLGNNIASFRLSIIVAFWLFLEKYLFAPVIYKIAIDIVNKKVLNKLVYKQEYL